jgi:two-component system phosphate regulon response regulator OmpR
VVQTPAAAQASDDIHVLIVDDEARVRKVLTDYLEEQNIRVSAAANGAEMWARLERTRVDVVLLDLVLPGEDGVTLAGELRRKTDVGIIMLTGRGDVVDRVVGLEVGADDYLTKPFHLREVLARIKSVVRRTRGAPGATPKEAEGAAGKMLRFAGLALHVDQRKLIGTDGKEVPLTTGEFDLLLVFAEHPNRVLDRDMLMDLAKGRQWEALDRSVDSQVARLRKKIEPDPANPTLIRSVRGAGYLFAAEVKRG